MLRIMFPYGSCSAHHAAACRQSREASQQAIASVEQGCQSWAEALLARSYFRSISDAVQLLLLHSIFCFRVGLLPMTAGLQYYCLSGQSVISAILRQTFLQRQGFLWQAMPLSGYPPQLMRHVEGMCRQANPMCRLAIN